MFIVLSVAEGGGIPVTGVIIGRKFEAVVFCYNFCITKVRLLWEFLRRLVPQRSSSYDLRVVQVSLEGNRKRKAVKLIINPLQFLFFPRPGRRSSKYHSLKTKTSKLSLEIRNSHNGS